MYTVQKFSVVQKYMDFEWFKDEAILINTKHGIETYGNSAYLVPNDRIETWNKIDYDYIFRNMIVKSSRWNTVVRVTSKDIIDETLEGVYLEGDYRGMKDKFNKDYFDLVLNNNPTNR